MRADRNVFGALRDLVEDRILRIQTLARLLHIPDLDRVADDQRARVRLQLPRQDLEQRGPVPFGPTTPRMAPGGR